MADLVYQKKLKVAANITRIRKVEKNPGLEESTE
jgi:hypothetical protein